ncbi:MAG TPA: hypothetical protein PK175_09010 [Syntrophales bacterium]|nr:hypothetical protein [Syntrophales bacterium]HRR46475.1 hypothetical protein [Syntrophales bacterium]
MNRLCIKAGPGAYARIRDGGFDLDAIACYAGPAVGPRWLIAGGFDLTLLREDALGRTRPVTLIGASAGAWRFAAWIQPEAEKSYRRLREAYIETVYTRGDRPASIRKSLADIIDRAIENDALPFALSSRKYRLAVITARARNLTAAENLLLQRLGFALAFLGNAASRRLLFRFQERVVFYTGPKPPAFTLRRDFQGRYVPLNTVNFKPALVASGAIPLLVAGVRDIYGAPRGVYRDGGLIDYHLAGDFGAKEGELTLLFHHQDRLIPGWLDKRFAKRKPSPDDIRNLILVHPSAEFVASLPLGKVPDREDFITFIDDPRTRIANWRRAVAMAEPLGEIFLELVAGGRIREVVRPLGEEGG